MISGGEKMKHLYKLTIVIMIIFFSVALMGMRNKNKGASENMSQPIINGNISVLAKKARSAVVNISTVQTIHGGGRVFRHFYGRPFNNPDQRNDHFNPFFKNEPRRGFKQNSLGSGFIIDREGYIVTNNHVIENADQIKVKMASGKEFMADLVGRDPKTDLALIKIKGSKDMVPLGLGDSEILEVGTWVVAIGSPFGLEQTVTAGIVSAKGRILGAGPYDDFIQTDASINPGNSGGPLIDMNGKVIGINTAIVSNGQGIGFAIPINLAKDIIEQLRKSGDVSRGWLGIGIQNITDELSKYYKLGKKSGVLVTHVNSGDPADKGGIKQNDIIIGIDGKSVSSSRQLSRIIAGTGVGKLTEISILRNGNEKTVHVTIAKRSDTKLLSYTKPEKQDDLGLVAEELVPDRAAQLGMDKNEKGILVVEVRPGSKGESAGLRAGDLVKEVNHISVTNLENYRKQIESLKEGEKFRILLKRRGVGYLAISMLA
jgi:serine protease Do